jgi:hypothetical protein
VIHRPTSPPRPVSDDASDDARLLDLTWNRNRPSCAIKSRFWSRRGSLPKKAATGPTWGVLGLGFVVLVALAIAALLPLRRTFVALPG